jgi:hypothetical protein
VYLPPESGNHGTKGGLGAAVVTTRPLRWPRHDRHGCRLDARADAQPTEIAAQMPADYAAAIDATKGMFISQA